MQHNATQRNSSEVVVLLLHRKRNGRHAAVAFFGFWFLEISFPVCFSSALPAQQEEEEQEDEEEEEEFAFHRKAGRRCGPDRTKPGWAGLGSPGGAGSGFRPYIYTILIIPPDGTRSYRIRDAAAVLLDAWTAEDCRAGGRTGDCRCSLFFIHLRTASLPAPAPPPEPQRSSGTAAPAKRQPTFRSVPFRSSVPFVCLICMRAWVHVCVWHLYVAYWHGPISNLTGSSK
ncbi:unnamed protein product [Calypogeia fissa]